eukprot:6176351-Pleurochrysis_carterae.AAC.1
MHTCRNQSSTFGFCARRMLLVARAAPSSLPSLRRICFLALDPHCPNHAVSFSFVASRQAVIALCYFAIRTQDWDANDVGFVNEDLAWYPE